MKPIKQLFQGISLKQWLVVFLAGLLMLTSTACGQPRVNSPTSSQQYNPNTPGQAMYPHKDTERDTRAVEAQTRQAIQQSERNLQKTRGPRDVLDNVTPDKSAAAQAEDIGRSAQRAAENIGKSTQRTAQNAAESTQDAVDRAANAVGRATNPG